MNLAEISFPVFKLRERPPERAGSVSYYITERFNQDTAEYTHTIHLIDDTSTPGETLSRRRLILEQEGVKLLKIKTAIYFLGDLIKSSKSTTWWIDSQGKIFQYKKTKKARLRFYPVEAIYPILGMGAVVKVKDIPQRFKILFMPELDKARWAGILEWQLGQKILYGLYAEQHKETWRLI